MALDPEDRRIKAYAGIVIDRSPLVRIVECAQRLLDIMQVIQTYLPSRGKQIAGCHHSRPICSASAPMAQKSCCG
jgi:hypothetical protein